MTIRVNKDCLAAWIPSCWVGGRNIVEISKMTFDCPEQNAAISAVSAIFRAMRKTSRKHNRK
jgi:hypothetical protein